jgi:predicted XRE-type DNA-binding protein
MYRSKFVFKGDCMAEKKSSPVLLVSAAACRRSRKMSKIEQGSTNVYADFGLENAEEMLVKAQLATKIGEIIKRRKLTQVQAAELLCMTQPKLSNLLRGQFRGISEAKILECMTRLERNVEIVIKPAGRSQSTGHVSVVFA